MVRLFARRKILRTFEEQNSVPLHFQAGRGSFHRKLPMPLRRSPRQTLQFCILRQINLVLRLLRNILGSSKFLPVSAMSSSCNGFGIGIALVKKDCALTLTLRSNL